MTRILIAERDWVNQSPSRCDDRLRRKTSRKEKRTTNANTTTSIASCCYFAVGIKWFTSRFASEWGFDRGHCTAL